MPILAMILAALVAVVAIPSCTAVSAYNAFQRRDEQVKQAYSQLLSVYQKRADLVPNLVDTVKGYASHESSTLVQVAQARAAAVKSAPPEDATPEQLEKFAATQKELSGVLGRLMMVVESNPNLKADAGFRKLQTQLQDVEAQAAAARNRYIREVTAYNLNVRTFPSNLVASAFGYGTKPQLQFEDERGLAKSPRTTFGK